MKSLIRKILLTEGIERTHLQKLYGSKIKKVAFKIIEKYYEVEREERWVFDDVDTLIKKLMSMLGLDKTEATFFLFSYLVEDGQDPTSQRALADWLYRVPDVVVKDFLQISGYYGEYVDYSNLTDLKEIGKDGKVYVEFSGWDEFRTWFDNEQVAEQVLGEDWADLFDLWDTPSEEIYGSLNAEGVKFITDTIIRENKGEYISELGHREEFEGITDDNGQLLIAGENITWIEGITDTYLLQVLIEESTLSGSDLIRHMRHSYNTAYNLAAEDELFALFKREIEDFMGAKVEMDDNGLKFNVTETIEGIIEKYVVTSHENPIEEYSTLGEILDNMFEHYITKLNTPDMNYYYSDSSLVEKHFNSMLQDY